MSANQNNVNLHIEELVLESIPPSDSNRITAVVQEELARLLGQGEFPVQNSSLEHMDGGGFQMKTGESTESTGIQIARSLYRGMKK